MNYLFRPTQNISAKSRLSFLTLWCDPRRLDATFGGVMGKYTEQAKLAAVKEYCAGKAGLRDVAR
ncbi:hypothetical protein, partial [Pseudomonas syringae]|uniref:hypothetical protein n=1 Tax=Pseudomonas syringae TaxID=317 RepID=UPI001CA5F189